MIRHFISLDKQSHRPERGCRVAVGVGKLRASPLTIQSGMKKTTNHQTREFKQKYGKKALLCG